MNKPTNLKLNYEQPTLPEIRKKLRRIQSYKHRADTTATVVKNLRAMQVSAWMLSMLRTYNGTDNPRLWLALKAAYNDLAIEEGTFDQWLNTLEKELE